MELKKIGIENIVKDKRTQPRAILDEYVINEYRQDMLIGDEFPPLIVFNENGKYYLADGFHRLAAAEQNGVKEIQCAVKPGSIREAILYSCKVNADHGKRRTNGDKRRAVMKLLNDPEWSKWSDNEIAKHCKVTQPFVGKLRSSLITVISEKREYTTKHGTVATMDISNIGKTKEPEPETQIQLTLPKPKYDPLNYHLFISPVDAISEQIDPGSVDAIITDPPYPKEYIPTYFQMAEQAAIILKPGGVLIALAGHPYTHIIIDGMNEYLHFHWLGCYYMPSGPHASLPRYNVSVYWKPLLIFSKGGWPNRAFKDVVINDEADKRYHEWGQGITGYKRLIESFSMPNETILDPFVGGGTTAIAALETGRYFIGSDISAEEINKTKVRLENGRENIHPTSENTR